MKARVKNVREGAEGLELPKQLKDELKKNVQSEKDAQDLEELGYVQELLREMGGFSNFAVSFSIISILTGATQLYGYGLQHGGPIQMTVGWGLVSLFTLFVALSMAELASAYPTAGALYHWSSFLGGRTLGWITACFNTMGQFAILAGIDYGLSEVLARLLGWSGGSAVLGIYLTVLFSHAALNHFGIRVVAWLNRFSAAYHILVVALLCGLLFSKGFTQPLSFAFEFHSTDGFSPRYSFLIGLLLAQWTLTGFDASAHVTEETIDPRRNAPWGIFLAVVISVIVGELMLMAVTLSISDLDQVIAAGDGAFGEVLRLRLGRGTGDFLSALIAGAMWLCGLSSMTSASRMVYAFARDGGLPGSKIWAKVSPKYRTPYPAIWGLAGLATVLAVSVSLYSAVVSVATISLYISYGLPIFARLYSRWMGRKDEVGPWNLGFWSNAVATLALVWVGIITVLFVMPPNQQAGSALGVLCLTLTGIWYSFARKRFRGPSYGNGAHHDETSRVRGSAGKRDRRAESWGVRLEKVAHQKFEEEFDSRP